MNSNLELYLESPTNLRIRHVDSLAAPNDNQVKVQVSYGGICGSDLRVYGGKISYANYPIRPGHEALGTIVEAGANTPYSLGTKVVVFPNTYCGDCEYCAVGKTNICIHKEPIGVSCDGVFANEVLVDAKYVVPVPVDMPDERAILIEPFAVTVHALKKANIQPGTSVAIMGCGTEGLLAVSIALHLDAKVTVIDINSNKFEIAKRLGNVQSMFPQEVNDAVFDVVIEAAGVPSAIEQAIKMVKPGGTMVALGITGESVQFSPIQVVRSEISIFGSIIYTKQDFADAIQYLNNPAFYIEPVVSKIYPLDLYQEAFTDALSGNHAKIVIDFRNTGK